MSIRQDLSIWPDWVKDAPIWFEVGMGIPGFGMCSAKMEDLPFFYGTEEEWAETTFKISSEQYLKWREWIKDGCKCRACYKNGNPCREVVKHGVWPSSFDPETSPYCDRHKDPANRGNSKVVKLAKPKKASSKRGGGFVYLMYAEGTPRYKIGLSHSPKSRNEAIDGQSPYPVKIVECYQVADMHEAEGYWHQRFNVERVHGEWFELSPEQVQEFISTAEEVAA